MGGASSYQNDMTVKLWRHITLLLLLGLLPFTAHGQLPELINDSEFRPDAKAAVDSIYNFNFSAADSIISPWKQQYPEHPLWHLFDGIQFWWQVL